MATAKKPTKTSIEKTDVYGITSLVLAILGLFPVGLIIGIIGEQKAKKERRSADLSRIAWIINLILTVLCIFALIAFLIFFVFLGNQINKAENQNRQADLRYFSNKLAEFKTKNGYYPPNLNQFNTSTIDNIDTDGTTYTYKVSPTGCIQCESYELSAELKDFYGTPTKYEIKSTEQ